MPTPTHDHDVFREQAALYAIGALEEAERAAFEAHAAGCAECTAEARSLLSVANTLSQTVPQYDPPPGLRDRVLKHVHPAGSSMKAREARPPRALAPWLSAAAALAIAVGLGAYAVSLRSRVAGLEGQLREAMIRIDAGEQQMVASRQLVASLQTPIAVLTAPDVKRFDLAGQAPAPQASARAFWSRARGLVFTGSQLPPLPAGRIYQLWVLTAQPAPISAGLLMPDPNGFVTTSFDTPPTIPEPMAVALTQEPAGGVPAPTGAMYLRGLAN
jgi:anti-sigma-K factor RskA